MQISPGDKAYAELNIQAGILPFPAPDRLLQDRLLVNSQEDLLFAISINAFMKSIGIGKAIVLLLSPAISVNVCR